VIYISSCFAYAKPACPYNDVQEIAEILEDKTGIQVFPGTHNYIYFIWRTQTKLGRQNLIVINLVSAISKPLFLLTLTISPT
jgi:hypothetical protein